MPAWPPWHSLGISRTVLPSTGVSPHEAEFYFLRKSNRKCFMKCCIHVCILNRPCPRPSKAWVIRREGLTIQMAQPQCLSGNIWLLPPCPSPVLKISCLEWFLEKPKNPPTPASVRTCTASAPSVWSQNATQRSLPVSLLTQPSLQDPNRLTYWRATIQKYELNLEWPSKHWSSFPGVWVQRAILDTAPLNKEM